MKPLLVSALVLLFTSGGSLRAADAPTADEWAPVEAALNAGDAAAPAKLAALIAAHPQWADGLRTLAQHQLRQGDRANAATNARKALALAPTDASAAAIAVQALGGNNGQPAEAYAIADQFTGAQDPQGWVNYYAAAVALDADDRKKAGLYLALAMGRAKNPPAEFAFLDARISEQAGDLPRAEAGYQRAVATNPRLWDAWYQLGVVQSRLADKGPGDRREWLTKSESNFVKVTANVPKEPLGWLGLGRTQLSLGQDLLTTNEDDGKAKAREATRSLRNALELRGDLRDAYLNLGVALLIGGNHQEAITHLLKARELGATDRNLGFNLMLAYQQAGKTAEFEAEAANVQATSVGERITLGMGFFKSGSYELAIQLLETALSGVADDRERSGQVHRFVGHAHAALAERARKRIPAGDASAAVPGDTKKAQLAEVDRELDAARDSWRKAGSYGDHTAQRFFMAQEAARSPQNGYDAGWQRLAWHNYLSLDGWMLVTGNYGGAVTGGQGLPGMWERHPAHVGIWGALIGLPLLLAIIGFFRRAPPPAEPTRSRDRDDSPVNRSAVPAVQRSRSAVSAPQPKASVPQPKSPTPAPPSRREHTPTPISKPKSVQRTPANPGKNETEPVSRSPEKNLTEPVAKPGAKPAVKSAPKQDNTPEVSPPVRDQRRTTEDAGGALERRKPTGGDDSALERKPGR